MAPAGAGEKAQGLGTAPMNWGAVKEAPILCVIQPVMTAAGALILFFFVHGLFDYLAPIVEAQ